MVGNVWEVTSDFCRPGHDPADTDTPAGPDANHAYDPYSPSVPSRTVKGGSYLCAPNYCQRYRPASRQGRDPGMGTSNVGFRLVYDQASAVTAAGGRRPTDRKSTRLNSSHKCPYTKPSLTCQNKH